MCNIDRIELSIRFLSSPWKSCRFLSFFLTDIDVGPNIVSDTFLTNDHAYICD